METPDPDSGHSPGGRADLLAGRVVTAHAGSAGRRRDHVLGFTDPLAVGAPLGAWDRSPEEQVVMRSPTKNQLFTFLSTPFRAVGDAFRTNPR
ncbi:MAG: hypothetical protein WKF75_13270, partial [Singulisphaera sp.]